MSPSESPAHEPATPSAAARRLRAPTVGLSAIALGLVGLYLVALLALYELAPSWLIDSLNLAVPVLLLTGAGVAIWKDLSPRVPLAVLLGCGGFLLYLAWDNPAPPPEIVLAPLIPHDSKNYEAYRWLEKSGPGSRVNNQPADRMWRAVWPISPEGRRAAVVADQSRWRDTWERDIVGREWYAALAGNEPEGVYPNDGPATPALRLQHVRHATQCHWARAILLQHDGDPDEAARLLLLVVRANYNLQRAGTTLGTQFLATMNLKGTYEQLALLLDSGKPSPDARDLIALVLRRAPPVRRGIDLAFLGEELTAVAPAGEVRGEPYAAITSVMPHDAFPVSHRFLGPFLLNRHRAVHEHLAFLRESRRLAQERHWDGTDRVELFRRRLQQRSLKNPVGRRLATHSFPALDAAVKYSWSNDDTRLALLQRIAAAPSLPTTPPSTSLPADPLVLEILNPRAPNDNRGAFVTTVYLVRNVSNEIVTFSGGPKYNWSTASGEAGSVGPMFMTGPTASNIQYGYGSVSDLELQPGQACAFVSETEFGPSPGYAIKVRFYRSEGGMMFDRAERAAGLRYYVQFNLSYVSRPVPPKNGASLSWRIERKTIQLTAPSIPILP